MTLTPLDIHNREFGRAFRGYAEAEVDEFLDTIVKEFEALIRENGELKDRLDDLEASVERYRSIEDTLNKTLLLAQQVSEDARLQAERESEAIRDRARAEAQHIVDEARERAKQALADYSDMRKEAEVFRMRMKTLLAAQLEVLEDSGLATALVDGGTFSPSRRAGLIAGRYGSPSERAPEERVEEKPEDEPGEEAAGIDFRRVERARPSLWGEPLKAEPVGDPDEGEEAW